MGERRFIICEIDQPAVGQIANYEITESELNKRWKIIRQLIYMHVDDKDLTNALFHGEGEKVEEPYIRSKCCVCGRDVFSDDSLVCPHDKLPNEPSPTQSEFARGFERGRESVQRNNPSGCCCKFDDAGETVIEPCMAHKAWRGRPSPTPTREEWEEWAEKFAKAIWWSKTDREEIVRVVLSMPCVPKE